MDIWAWLGDVNWVGVAMAVIFLMFAYRQRTAEDPGWLDHRKAGYASALCFLVVMTILMVICTFAPSSVVNNTTLWFGVGMFLTVAYLFSLCWVFDPLDKYQPAATTTDIVVTNMR